jgi:hypothetical protein
MLAYVRLSYFNSPLHDPIIIPPFFLFVSGPRRAQRASPVAWLPVFSAEAFWLTVISAFSLLSTQLRCQLSVKQNNVHFSFAFLVLTLRYHRFRATACAARVTSTLTPRSKVGSQIRCCIDVMVAA